MSTEDKIEPTLWLERSHGFGNGDVVGALRFGEERIWLDRVPAGAWSALEAALAAHAELEAARPVVEAARRIDAVAEQQTEAICSLNPMVRTRQMDWELQMYHSIRSMLHDGLAAYRSATSDHPSTTEEKP